MQHALSPSLAVYIYIRQTTKKYRSRPRVLLGRKIARRVVTYNLLKNIFKKELVHPLRSTVKNFVKLLEFRESNVKLLSRSTLPADF